MATEIFCQNVSTFPVYSKHFRMHITTILTWCGTLISHSRENMHFINIFRIFKFKMQRLHAIAKFEKQTVRFLKKILPEIGGQIFKYEKVIFPVHSNL